MSRLDDLGLRSLEITVIDVMLDGIMEKHGILGDNRNMLSQAIEIEGVDVMTCYLDAARIRLVESIEQSNQRRLARP